MKRFMLSAMHSGSGKTVVTCGLLRAFQDRGLSVESFKCGPDYIDPMFHEHILGVPSRNLDLFLQGVEGVGILSITAREPEYDPVGDCFAARLEAECRCWLCAEAAPDETPTLTHFILKGALT